MLACLLLSLLVGGHGVRAVRSPGTAVRARAAPASPPSRALAAPRLPSPLGPPPAPPLFRLADVPIPLGGSGGSGGGVAHLFHPRSVPAFGPGSSYGRSVRGTASGVELSSAYVGGAGLLSSSLAHSSPGRGSRAPGNSSPSSYYRGVTLSRQSSGGAIAPLSGSSHRGVPPLHVAPPQGLRPPGITRSRTFRCVQGRRPGWGSLLCRCRCRVVSLVGGCAWPGAGAGAGGGWTQTAVRRAAAAQLTDPPPPPAFSAVALPSHGMADLPASTELEPRHSSHHGCDMFKLFPGGWVAVLVASLLGVALLVCAAPVPCLLIVCSTHPHVSSRPTRKGSRLCWLAAPHGAGS